MSVSTWISRAAGHTANRSDGLPRPDPSAFDGAGYSTDAFGLNHRYRGASLQDAPEGLIPVRRTLRPTSSDMLFAASICDAVGEPQNHTAPAA